MTEYWLISAPGMKTPQNTFERLQQATNVGSDKLSENYKFHIPELKVGTLDTLVGLSDDLGKLDGYTEGVVRKVVSTLDDVLESGSKDTLTENLKVEKMPATTYLSKFQWDHTKFPVKQSPKALADIIQKDVHHIESELKARSNAYNTLKGNLAQLERKSVGSLLTRNVADLVKKDDFVLNSEYLVTLVVVIPKANSDEWWKNYERLSEKVVPRSSKMVFEDSENQLVTVTLFRLAVDNFKTKCREYRFMVRDFEYNEEDIASSKKDFEKLAADKQKQYSPLVKWLSINFGECFKTWMHVKGLRVFVESVLRYGLPVNFQAMVVKPLKKNHKKLRETLIQLYGHLDSTALTQTKVSNMEIPGLNLTSSDYYPYVFYKISLEMTEQNR